VSYEKFIENTVINDGVIDGFKKPNKVLNYFGIQNDLEWINSANSDDYFSNILIMKKQKAKNFLNKLDIVLKDEYECAGDNDTLFILLWENEDDVMLAIISIIDGTSHLLKDIVPKYWGAADYAENSPNEVEVHITNNDVYTTREDLWLSNVLNEFILIPDE